MRFSKRTDWNTEESELALAHRERLATGSPIADLTASNPTRCGFDYQENLLSPLADSMALDYDPNPKGNLRAREAVSRYYADHGIAGFDSGNLLLTTSTSEAYSFLLKVLCDPGDQVLVPAPSYPLFDYLADAEVVTLAAAPLVYDHGWQLDIEGLRRAITPRTKAVVLVHPNNPTGHFTKIEETLRLASVCEESGLALIVDEVFLDYGLAASDASVNAESRSSFLGRELGVLAFVVSGISKIAGLPQMKAAWLAATGPGSVEAMSRLEVVADTYLSMNAPVQYALPSWLQRRAEIQSQIKTRVAGNLAELDLQLAGQPIGGSLVNRLEVEGGWYAVLRIPALQTDELTVRELLALGVWVHPGYFFGMGRSGWLVVSLLGFSDDFKRGMTILLSYVSRYSSQ